MGDNYDQDVKGGWGNMGGYGMEGESNRDPLQGARSRQEAITDEWAAGFRSNELRVHKNYIDEQDMGGYNHAEARRHSTTRPYEEQQEVQHYLDFDIDGNKRVSVTYKSSLN